MPFLTPAVMIAYESDKWIMDEDLDYQYGSKLIRVPKGFVHDLASIPRPFNLFIRKNGLHRQPAILHDWFYFNMGLISQFKRLTRAECDEIFYRAMLEGGVGNATSYIMYRAVRAFGWLAWRNHAKRIKASR